MEMYDPTSINALPLSPSLIESPCGACKTLRRKCLERCILAPYFPPSDPLKFIAAHRVFGASNIIKFLHLLPESRRADAVTSMVYEAKARIMDPVYGSTGVIYKLQKQVSDLQIQLVKVQAEILNLQSQYAQHIEEINCIDMAQYQHFTLKPFEPTVNSNAHALVCNTDSLDGLRI